MLQNWVVWFHHVCAQTRLCPNTFVPTHVCAHIRFCPDTFVPTRFSPYTFVPRHVCTRHVCAHTRLCPDTFVPRHDCAHTWLCPDTLVPQHELWLDTIMSLDNNNIIIVSIRLCVNLIGENTSMLNFQNTSILNCCWRSEVKCDYLTTVQQSPPTGIFRNFYYNMSGHKICVKAQTYTFVPKHDCDHAIITCQGTNVCGHKHVRAQSVWAQSVWAQTCGLRVAVRIP